MKPSFRPKKRFFVFVAFFLILIGFGVFFLWQKFYKEDLFTGTLSEDAQVVFDGNKLYVLDQNRLTVYQGNTSLFSIESPSKINDFVPLGGNIYLAVDKELVEYNRKGEKISSKSTTHPIQKLKTFLDTVFIMTDHEVIQKKGEHFIFYPAQGFVVDFDVNKNNVLLIDLSEEDGKIKSQLSKYTVDGKLEFSFPFLDEIMESVSIQSNGEYYILTNKNYYRFNHMSVTDKKELSRLYSTYKNNHAFYYLDDCKLVIHDFDSGDEDEKYLTDHYGHIVAKDNILLYEDKNYVYISPQSANIGETPAKILYAYFKDAPYLVTTQGTVKLDKK